MNLSTLLFRLGITPNYKAYHQIITAITLSSENTGLLMRWSGISGWRRTGPGSAIRRCWRSWRAIPWPIRQPPPS